MTYYKTDKRYKHGMYHTPTHISWMNMKARCLNKKHNRYKDYGGRGITICDFWINSFNNFHEDMGKLPSGMTLERVDNNKGYYKDNCKWATPTAQTNNTRRNRVTIYQGNQITVSQLSKKLNINESTIRKRLDRGAPCDQGLWERKRDSKCAT